MNIAPKSNVSKSFDKLDTKMLEDVITTFYMGKFCGCSPEEISKIKVNGNAEFMLKFLFNEAHNAVDRGEAENLYTGMQIGICYYQDCVQLRRWYRSKQVYSFDADMLKELIRTDITDITLLYDVFEHLPNRSVYLDFSASPEIVNLIDADGCIAQVQTANLVEDNNDQYHIILMLFYKENNIKMIKAMVLPNEKDGSKIAIDDVLKSAGSLGLFTNSTSELPEDCRPKLQELLTLQCLLYLCSYEPDIYETTVSKMQNRKAKQSKNKNKPNREFKVGERFGTAYRKWTKRLLGQSDEHTSTERRNKPHIRKAHWHRHWIGKHGSDKRKLVVRWHYECFCGLTEKEAEDKLDTVKHSVK